jgi:predicted regulator of Ras-like GTPase activity (Roadblock/LC7/MglB family)
LTWAAKLSCDTLFGVTLGLVFQEALRDIVDKVEGGVAGLIMDSEGIAVDSYARDGAPFDINVVGIEFGVVLGSIKRAAESLEAGKAHEVAIGTDKMITLIRTLGDTYFLALTLKPDGNLGKGRFLMRTAAPKLIAELT